MISVWNLGAQAKVDELCLTTKLTFLSFFSNEDDNDFLLVHQRDSKDLHSQGLWLLDLESKLQDNKFSADPLENWFELVCRRLRFFGEQSWKDNNPSGGD
jgi:hypothetical protein